MCVLPAALLGRVRSGDAIRQSAAGGRCGCAHWPAVAPLDCQHWLATCNRRRTTGTTVRSTGYGRAVSLRERCAQVDEKALGREWSRDRPEPDCPYAMTEALYPASTCSHPVVRQAAAPAEPHSCASIGGGCVGYPWPAVSPVCEHRSAPKQQSRQDTVKARTSPAQRHYSTSRAASCTHGLCGSVSRVASGTVCTICGPTDAYNCACSVSSSKTWSNLCVTLHRGIAFALALALACKPS